jgi:enoyl-CoA hydratase/carnithine racemase
MPGIELAKEGAVFVLRLGDDENRFNRRFVDDVSKALDEVASTSGPAALVTTGTGKIYSNGLDLAWMTSGGRDQIGPFLADVLKLLGRFLAFPRPTVAAVNGHCVAAGAMLAIAHDYRVMRADRGFFSLPEIDLKLPLQPGMTALLQTKLTANVLRDTVLTGVRLGGQAAQHQGIMDDAVAEDEVLPRAIARAAALADKDAATMGALKRGLYADALRTLGLPIA